MEPLSSRDTIYCTPEPIQVDYSPTPGEERIKSVCGSTSFGFGTEENSSIESSGLVAKFRNRLWIKTAIKPTLNDAMFRGRPWCNERTLIPVLVSPPLYVVLNQHLGTTRFLVYDEIEDSFMWIGDDPSDAADAWNFADLGRWIVVNDSTGDKESYAVKDPSISEAVGQALEYLGIQSEAGE
jgi:hypothetical protein